MTGIITLIVAASLGWTAPADSTCPRDQYRLSEQGTSVRCLSTEEYRARRAELRLRRRRELARAAERRYERQQADERLRRKREARKREERRLAERRLNER